MIRKENQIFSRIKEAIGALANEERMRQREQPNREADTIDQTVGTVGGKAANIIKEDS